jgi:hypothetical protein
MATAADDYVTLLVLMGKIDFAITSIKWFKGI